MKKYYNDLPEFYQYMCDAKCELLESAIILVKRNEQGTPAYNQIIAQIDLMSDMIEQYQKERDKASKEFWESMRRYQE